MQFGQYCPALPGVAVGVIRLGRRHHIYQVMGHPGLFGRRGLGGADVQLPVDLEGVGVDDLRPEAFGQPQGHPGFTHRGGAD